MSINSCLIVYKNEKCLNNKKPFAHPCRLCIESCPHGAISEYRKLDAKRCTECGVCLAICPGEAFVDRLAGKLHDYLFTAAPLVLNCPQAAPQGFEISCLGILNRDLWVLLILLAGNKPVSIFTGNCAECPDRPACIYSVRTFKALHLAWPEHSAIRIVVCPETRAELPGSDLSIAPKGPSSNNSIRDVFPTLLQSSLKTVEKFVPNLRQKTVNGIEKSSVRSWLAEALHLFPESMLSFPILEAADSCSSCGVCAVICPEAALEKQEKNGEISLWLELLKCVQCNRCVEICLPKALSIKPQFIFGHQLIGKQLLHEGYLHFCSRCGKQLFQNASENLCPACATSAVNTGFNNSLGPED